MRGILDSDRQSGTDYLSNTIIGSACSKTLASSLQDFGTVFTKDFDVALFVDSRSSSDRRSFIHSFFYSSILLFIHSSLIDVIVNLASFLHSEIYSLQYFFLPFLLSLLPSFVHFLVFPSLFVHSPNPPPCDLFFHSFTQ